MKVSIEQVRAMAAAAYVFVRDKRHWQVLSAWEEHFTTRDPNTNETHLFLYKEVNMETDWFLKLVPVECPPPVYKAEDCNLLLSSFSFAVIGTQELLMDGSLCSEIYSSVYGKGHIVNQRAPDNADDSLTVSRQGFRYWDRGVFTSE